MDGVTELENKIKALEHEVHCLLQTVSANEKVKTALRRELEAARESAVKADAALEMAVKAEQALRDRALKLCGAVELFEWSLRRRWWPWISTRKVLLAWQAAYNAGKVVFQDGKDGDQ